MGYDETNVYDLATEIAAEPVEPLDEAVDMIKRVMASDRAFTAAQWFAYGRLHYEPSPLPGAEAELSDDDAALGFAVQYQAMMVAFHDRRRRDVVQMAAAWENYVASAGGTIEQVGAVPIDNEGVPYVRPRQD